MFLCVVVLIFSNHIFTSNGAQLRTVRSTPNDQQLCDDQSSGGYSEFILKEGVIIGPNDQPLIDGVVILY